MEICGEHGEEIVFYGRDCPMCDQVSDLLKENNDEIETLREDMQSEIDDLQDKIDELESK